MDPADAAGAKSAMPCAPGGVTEGAKCSPKVAPSAPPAPSPACPSDSDSSCSEAFETFQTKVLALCADIFPQAARRDMGSFHLQNSPGGSFNRIIYLTVDPPPVQRFSPAWIDRRIKKLFRRKYTAPPPTECVFRIPRDYDREPMEMEYDTATLKFVAQNLRQPIPSLLHCDTGNKNAISNQYMLQQRLRGQNLELMRDHLTTSQLKQLVTQIMDIQQALRKITSPAAGLVHPATASQTSSDLKLSKLLVRRVGARPDYIPATAQTTIELLVEMAERQQELDAGANKKGFVLPVFEQLKKVARHMHTRGFLPDSEPFHFCHLDLYPRNILVDLPDDDTLRITGLLDWDAEYVHFCPKFTAYRAPFWLWVDDTGLEHEEKRVNCPVDSSNKAMAKKLFEETAGEEWLRFAFQPEYILARRLFRVLETGIHFTQIGDEAEAIVAEWKQLYPADDVRSRLEEAQDYYICPITFPSDQPPTASIPDDDADSHPDIEYSDKDRANV